MRASILLCVAASLPLGSCTAEVADEPMTFTSVVRQVGIARRTGDSTMGREISAGLNIDGLVSSRADEDGCNKKDMISPNGEEGIDNNFSFLFEAVEAFAEPGTAEALLHEAIREGRVLIMFQLREVDDMENDDHVVFRVFSGQGDPADQGGLLISDQTFDLREDAPVVEAPGRIVDGVLEAGPIELVIPISILLANFDLIIKDARVHGTVDESGNWDLTIGGAVPGATITEVAYEADRLEEVNEYGPLVDAFLPMWTDLPDEDGECTAISANILLKTVNAFLYPDAKFADE